VSSKRLEACGGALGTRRGLSLGACRRALIGEELTLEPGYRLVDGVEGYAQAGLLFLIKGRLA
jgi:hypothetical protein